MENKYVEIIVNHDFHNSVIRECLNCSKLVPVPHINYVNPDIFNALLRRDREKEKWTISDMYSWLKIMDPDPKTNCQIFVNHRKECKISYDMCLNQYTIYAPIMNNSQVESVSIDNKKLEKFINPIYELLATVFGISVNDMKEMIEIKIRDNS